MRQMIPVRTKDIRESLHLKRAQVAREANMQAGVVGWIEEGRFVPYETQIEKIAKVFRKHGWDGETEELLEEVV